MSIKYRLKNMDPIIKAIRELYSDIAHQESSLDGIGKFVRDRIVAETRKGNDLTKGGIKQPPLSEGYIQKRYKLKSGVDKTFFRPSLSNLTLSGQLLDSIEYKITVSQSKIVISPTGVRDDGMRNEALAQELADRSTRLAPRGRHFLGLDDRGYKRIRAKIIEAIRRMAEKKGL